jgi:uncharacterized membrane protein YgdD (TMEM256/DUF423 family)
MVDRTFFVLGALFAMLGVAAGAFGAHALADRLTPERLATFEVAVRYQVIHALGLFVIAWATTRWPSGLLHVAGWLFVVGILVFGSTVYALALGGPRILGAITPLGGLSFIVGWVLAGWAVMRA